MDAEKTEPEFQIFWLQGRDTVVVVGGRKFRVKREPEWVEHTPTEKRHRHATTHTPSH